MNTYLIVMPDHTVWYVVADNSERAVSQYHREMPRARGRHRGVYLQVVPPHRMNEPTPVEREGIEGCESCPCCLRGVSHREALQRDLLSLVCKTCGHIAYVHRNTDGGTDDRHSPEPG